MSQSSENTKLGYNFSKGFDSNSYIIVDLDKIKFRKPEIFFDCHFGDGMENILKAIKHLDTIIGIPDKNHHTISLDAVQKPNGEFQALDTELLFVCKQLLRHISVRIVNEPIQNVDYSNIRIVNVPISKTDIMKECLALKYIQSASYGATCNNQTDDDLVLVWQANNNYQINVYSPSNNYASPPNALVNVRDIFFTRPTIPFSKLGQENLGAWVERIRQNMTLSFKNPQVPNGYPTLRIARKNNKWYSSDNRFLFVLKVIFDGAKIPVFKTEWKQDFENHLVGAGTEKIIVKKTPRGFSSWENLHFVLKLEYDGPLISNQTWQNASTLLGEFESLDLGKDVGSGGMLQPPNTFVRIQSIRWTDNRIDFFLENQQTLASSLKQLEKGIQLCSDDAEEGKLQVLEVYCIDDDSEYATNDNQLLFIYRQMFFPDTWIPVVKVHRPEIASQKSHPVIRSVIVENVPKGFEDIIESPYVSEIHYESKHQSGAKGVMKWIKHKRENGTVQRQNILLYEPSNRYPSPPNKLVDIGNILWTRAIVPFQVPGKSNVDAMIKEVEISEMKIFKSPQSPGGLSTLRVARRPDATHGDIYYASDNTMLLVCKMSFSAGTEIPVFETEWGQEFQNMLIGDGNDKITVTGVPVTYRVFKNEPFVDNVEYVSTISN